MVRLNRITLYGFKSFGNRVTIPFPEGFNVIAGPNGSGKSNIIDAIMFVLGTTSARSIRAQKLQNLIFNGGKNRKPAEFCEVSLYLDNNDNKIPGEKEIKIMRRVSRNGISIYKLNGRTVTRSKILDILSYANLSAEGYNIIMQGDVTKIIEMSPLERREIIDEISGIKEFDEKREKATKELEKVETRVRENMIVVAEKQKLVIRLKQEKENAEKYQKLSEELKRAKASLIKKRLDNTEEKMKILDKDIRENTEKFDKLEKEFRTIETELEDKEKKIQKINDEIIKRSRNYEIMKKIDSLQMEILRKKDKIDLNERELQRLKSIYFEKPVIKEILNLKHDEIYGTVSSLIEIPKKYEIALDVAIGKHKNDIIVSTDDVASFCIKHLKENKIGRARFLPLNKIKGKKKKQYKGDIIGYAIDLVKFDKKYYPAMEYVLGNTLVVKDIDTAKKIPGFRIVTLDGDLIEISGAMIGGFYQKKHAIHSNEIKKLEDENKKLIFEIEKLEKELENVKKLEKEESEDVMKLQKEKSEIEKTIEDYRNKRKTIYEERIVLQNNITKLKIEKAHLEATLSNLKLEFEDYKDVKEFLKLSEDELQELVKKYIIEINKLGPVNMKAIEEYQTINIEFEELKKKLDKLIEEKDAILKIVQEVEKKRRDKFMETLNGIAENFTRIYKDLTNGFGTIRLEVENNIDSGLIIEASPSGKNVLNLDSMSGGEKTLASLAFLFALMQYKSAPFYVLDEVDAALDKANTKKITNLIKKYSKDVQFIVITHNDITTAEADKVFGVSMEDGVSKVFGIELPKG
ncbi:MAG: chromosome segregation SMC family protein [Candidatus Aenigmatarchaeota archaeon]